MFSLLRDKKRLLDRIEKLELRVTHLEALHMAHAKVLGEAIRDASSIQSGLSERVGALERVIREAASDIQRHLNDNRSNWSSFRGDEERKISILEAGVLELERKLDVLWNNDTNAPRSPLDMLQQHALPPKDVMSDDPDEVD